MHIDIPTCMLNEVKYPCTRFFAGCESSHVEKSRAEQLIRKGRIGNAPNDKKRKLSFNIFYLINGKKWLCTNYEFPSTKRKHLSLHRLSLFSQKNFSPSSVSRPTRRIRDISSNDISSNDISSNSISSNSVLSNDILSNDIVE
jgi:hypothetical protein